MLAKVYIFATYLFICIKQTFYLALAFLPVKKMQKPEFLTVAIELFAVHTFDGNHYNLF